MLPHTRYRTPMRPSGALSLSLSYLYHGVGRVPPSHCPGSRDGTLAVTESGTSIIQRLCFQDSG